MIELMQWSAKFLEAWTRDPSKVSEVRLGCSRRKVERLADSSSHSIQSLAHAAEPDLPPEATDSYSLDPADSLAESRSLAAPDFVVVQHAPN